jgi:hypothetical protein
MVIHFRDKLSKLASKVAGLTGRFIAQPATRDGSLASLLVASQRCCAR